MSVSPVSPSVWNSHAAWSRRSGARAKLAMDLVPCQASPAVLTADRAAVVAAEAEVGRIEAARAAAIARFEGSGRFLDISV